MSLPWQLALGNDTPTTVVTGAGRIQMSGPQFLDIAGGSPNQVLMTDGAANLRWGTVSGGPGGGNPPGGSPGQVQINIAGTSFGGLTMSGDATWNTSTGALTLANANAGAATVQGITFDQKGRITAAVNQNYLTGNQSITLSSDLSGSGTTAIAATVIRLQGVAVSPTAPTVNQVLQFVGGQWTPQPPPSGSSGLSGMTAGQIPIPNSATTINASGNLSGDVTTSNSLVTTIGALRVQTGMLAAGAVTYPKIQNVAAAALIGNSTGAAAAPQDVTLGARLAFAGTVLNATPAGATGNAQFNNAGVIGASTGLTLSATTLTGVAINLSGSDATGDIYYRNASGNLNRLAIGTANQVLAVSAGLIPNWVAASGGGVSGSGLTNNAVIIGTGGTGIAALAAVGATGTVLRGATGAAPAFGAVNLATDVTGTLQAAQEPAHTGDVTNSAGSLVLAIANNAVTYPKMQTVTASRLLGNPTASPAIPSEISVGTGLNLSTGGVLTATAVAPAAVYSAGWTAGGSPDKGVLYRADQARTITALSGVLSAGQSGVTVAVQKVAAGASTGTAIHAGAGFDCSGAVLTSDQTISLTTTALATGDRLMLAVTGTPSTCAGSIFVTIQ